MHSDVCLCRSNDANRAMSIPEESRRGLTVREVARLYRVNADKIRRWIASGELKAVNTASVLSGKPRWVIMPEALAEFEKRRRSSPAPKPTRKRRRRKEMIDYFPD